MFSVFDFFLSVHRAIWFPVNALLGLEARGIEMPAEFAPDASMGLVDPNSPALQAVQPRGHRIRRAGGF